MQKLIHTLEAFHIGEIVSDKDGNVYEVIDKGTYSKLRRYDSLGTGEEFYRDLGDSQLYIAVEDEFETTSVFPVSELKESDGQYKAIPYRLTDLEKEFDSDDTSFGRGGFDDEKY